MRQTSRQIFGGDMRSIRHIWLNTVLWLVLCMSIMPRLSFAQEHDFHQTYEQGRLFLNQKRYYDAIREFIKANETIQGRTHFGVYYYLGYAYFWLPDLQRAMHNLKIAHRLAKTTNQREALRKLWQQIRTLYGEFQIDPEVDPHDVGPLKLSLTPKLEFSHPHKRRYSRIISDQLKKQGIVVSGGVIYLPKGDYTIAIQEPQCLQYALIQESATVREISVGDTRVRLSLKAVRSCECQGGQKIYTRGRQLYCACPPGTGWNKKINRCEVGINPVPWIAAGIGVVVVGTTAVIIGIAVSLNDGTDYRLIQAKGGKTGENSVKLWK